MADPATIAAPALRAMEPLAGHYAAGPGVALSPIGPRMHVSLRADPASVSALDAVLGIALPDRPKTSVVGKGLAALWLGPQDWLLVGDAGRASGLVAAVEGSSAVAHSAVDVSHRHVGITIEGPAAEAVLAAGCPRDLRLRSFPVGAVSRSILSKADIVVWRRGETVFEVLCVRSFADYVWAFLVEAARSPAM